MKDGEIFLKKMKAMSMIKAELIKNGKDPDIIERVLMNDYDTEKGSISKMMEEIDLDDDEQFGKLMEMVNKKI